MSFSSTICFLISSSQHIGSHLHTSRRFRLSPSLMLMSLNSTSSLLVLHSITLGITVVCSFWYFFWNLSGIFILSTNSFCVLASIFFNDALSPNCMSIFFWINGPITLSGSFGFILFKINTLSSNVNIVFKKNDLPHPVGP